MAFFADLRSVLAERGFRRLYATRLISQTGDGMFNAGFAAYAFFSAQSFPDPATATTAFAVLYVPYSVIGPFAGVFIDRWSRRNILVCCALIRAVMVGFTAYIVGSGTLGLPLYVCALAVLGINRFFFGALSAGLPHVVAADKLVMANAVAPTSGTVVAFTGGIIGLGVHLATGGGHLGSAATLLAAAAAYLLASLTAATMPRGLLGPHRDPAEPSPATLPAELRHVASGVAAGMRHLARRRHAAYALATITSHRFLYGILLLMTILLYRNYFYPAGNGNAALGHLTLLVTTSAIGYLAAALITPALTGRVSKHGLITSLLAVGAVATGASGPTFRQPAFLLLGLVLGVVAQGVKICVDATLQQHVDDAYLGRVFSVYDMLFNVAFVLGAAIAAPFTPVTGRSLPLVLLAALGYLLTAAAYGAVSRAQVLPQPQPQPGVPVSRR